jgi:mycothiol synthase
MLFPATDSNCSVEELVLGPARPEEYGAVALLLHRHLPAALQSERAAHTWEWLRRGQAPAEGVLVARAAGTLCAALVCVPLAGASALFWLPQALPGYEAAAARLVAQALAWVRQGGARLAQAFLTSEELPLAGPLRQQGFRHITTLLYLRRDLSHGLPAGAACPLLVFQPAEEEMALFQHTLLRTYEQTQDCPELQGVRTLQEILEGHRAQSGGLPGSWWLARRYGQGVGVLLLNPVPDWQAWDISYLGVVPEARRQGVGQALTRWALQVAQRQGAHQVTLAVDCRNLPARRLYHQLGFVPEDQREVFLHFLDPAPADNR